MYQIIKNGERLTTVERPNYIRQLEDLTFTSCPEDQAQGVSVLGTPYNLFGREPMQSQTEEPLETVLVNFIDNGLLQGETDESLAGVKQQLAEADDTAIDLYEKSLLQSEINETQEATNTRQAQINESVDETLIGLYEQIEGLKNN